LLCQNKGISKTFVRRLECPRCHVVGMACDGRESGRERMRIRTWQRRAAALATALSGMLENRRKRFAVRTDSGSGERFLVQARYRGLDSRFYSLFQTASCVCVCVRVCACASERAYVRVCVYSAKWEKSVRRDAEEGERG